MAPVDSFFVTRTLQAIEVLAFQPASAPQVAEALRVDARTARRLLNRLADDGWVVRIDGRVRMYTLSLRLVALASQFVERAPLTHVAASVVRSLHERTGGVAYVTVPSYRSVLCLAHRAGEGRSRPHTGELIPAHATAAGKVLLAHRGPWRESVLERPLERVTERTVVDPDAVRSECDLALEQGFAFEDGEYGVGLQSIAAPVRGGSGGVMAAVGLAGPPELDVSSQLDAVVEAARTLARKVGESGVARAA
jgi:DNA-binding IclR family transcriptional regulator